MWKQQWNFIAFSRVLFNSMHLEYRICYFRTKNDLKNNLRSPLLPLHTFTRGEAVTENWEGTYRGTLNPNFRRGLRKRGEERALQGMGSACHVQVSHLWVFWENHQNSGRIYFTLNREFEFKVKKTNKVWWEEHWMGSLETQVVLLALLVTG